MTFELEIEINGSVFSLDVFDASLTDVYGEESRLTVTVLRDEFQPIIENNDISLATVSFFRFGTNEFAGRIVDYTNQTERVELAIGTFEEDAINAKPTAATLTFAGATDVEIIQNAISRVDSLSEGTIENIDSNVDILFSNASPAKMIREVQRETGAFVRYNPDGTVDYVGQCGNDRTATTISPSNSNVSESFNVNEFDRERYNHLRVLGASQGDSQIQAEAIIPSFDPATDRERWKVYSDKEIISNERAQKVADTIIAEYDDAPIRVDVETVVFDVDLQIGDVFTVVSDRDNLNQELQVVEVTELLQGNQDVYEVVFSNRLITRLTDAEKQRRDVEKFNQAFQGDVVTLTSGGYRAPVDSNNSYVLSVRKPSDVVQELTAEIEIVGLPYRFYSSPVPHNHDFDIDIPSHTHDVDIDIPAHTHSVDIDIPNHTHDVSIDIPAHTHSVDFTIPNHTHDVDIDIPNHTHQVDIDIPSHDHGVTIDIPDHDHSVVVFHPSHSHGYTLRAPPHQHILNEPGIDASLGSTLNADTAFDTDHDHIYEVQADLTSFEEESETSDTALGSTTSETTQDGGGFFSSQTTDDGGSEFITTSSDAGGSEQLVETTGEGGSEQVAETTSNGGNEQLTETSDNGGGFFSSETTSDGGSEQLVETSDSGGGFFSSETTSSTAGVDAGIEETTDTPSNVDVIVNGNTVATNVASGQFNEVVDIAGELTEGFNTIEIQSDSLGHIRATTFLDLYRQITQ